jgi:YYY domain-containing protein
LLLYAAGYVAFLPFYQSYELFYTGVTISAEQTTLAQYLGVHGLFLFLAVSLLAVELQRRFAGSTTERYLGLAARNWDRLPHFLTLSAKLGNSTVGLGLVLAILGVVAYVALSFVGLPVPAFALTLLLVCGVLAARILWSGRIEVEKDLFILTMLAGAFGLGAFVDVFTLQGDIARMNTVFKFYLQAWTMMGMVAAYAFWRLVILPWNSLRAGRTLWMGLLTVLLVAVFIYPLAATPVRVKDRFEQLPPTDDGLSYMQTATYQDERGPMDLKYDYDAIQWLRQNVDGTPVIVEGTEPIYRWGSRISVNTGLPTVLGWDWHQTQQRWGYQDMVSARENEVNNFYVTNDTNAAQSFLQKYAVRYVVVGNVETKYYPQTGLAKFNQMVGRQLEVAYQNPGTTIYRVLT